LLGFFGDSKQYVKMKQASIEKYDCICFDEIMINPPYLLQKIDLFMKANPNKKYFANGDVDQLQPIDFRANSVEDPRHYLLDCLNQMFPNQMTLKINKRLKTEEQRMKLYQLKADIFDKEKDILTILKEYGFKVIKNYSQLTTTQNICYFNYRTRDVNRQVHNNLIEKPNKATKIGNVQYWNGLELICKKHYSVAGVRTFKNYTYVISSISEQSFSISDLIEETSFTFPIEMLDHFNLPYANTCHSVQGMSIDGPITIFDVNTPYVDRFYMWTAITRATDLDQIVIFEHSQAEVTRLENARVQQYLKFKVDGYKNQDKIARRDWNSDYITPEWINEQFSNLDVKCCFLCRTPYEIEIDKDGKVTTNMTVDRIDNTQPHVKTNSRLCCMLCNVAKH
jgi:hypothetical protein